MKRFLAWFCTILILFAVTPAAYAVGDVPQAVLNARKSVFRVMAEDNKNSYSGSCFVIATDDTATYFATCYHVLENTDIEKFKIVLHDTSRVEAELVAFDKDYDTCIIKTREPIEGAIPLALADEERLITGSAVYALGFPAVGDYFMNDYAYHYDDMTVTDGIVTALRRGMLNENKRALVLQMNVAINPGNSGGPLVDVNGRLVGINTAIYSRSGGNMGIGFAIPSQMVKMVVESARLGSKTVQRPWLGARLQAVTPEMAEAVGLDHPTGVMVTMVTPKGPAEAAGLKRGDVILAVDGQTIEDPDSFGYRFALKGIGGETRLSTMREGKPGTVTVKLAPPAETRPRDAMSVTVRSPLMGAVIENISPAVAEEMQIDLSDANEGVVISEVADGSTAQRFGFQRGDLILAINRNKIGVTKDVETALSERSRFWEITINRGGRVMTTVLGGG